MKPLEILVGLPPWSVLKPAQILASPAFAMPCRFADQNAVVRLDAPSGADALFLDVRFADEPHVLGIRDSARFESLHALWPYRAETPAPILLALVEKECAPLLQTLENAVRCQLRIAGLADAEGAATSGEDGDVLCGRVADVEFSLSRSAAVDEAFGSLRNLDLSHPSVRDTPLDAEVEHAAFALSAADIASLAPGDALFLPEVGSVRPRFIVDNSLAADENGVSPFLRDDTRVRVRDAEPRRISLGTLLDWAQSGCNETAAPAFALRLANSAGRTLASGHREKIAGNTAFVVESSAANP